MSKFIVTVQYRVEDKGGVCDTTEEWERLKLNAGKSSKKNTGLSY